MDLTSLLLFQMATTKMDWAAQRQKVPTQNVVNADTPDYKSRDLKPLDFKHGLRDEVRPVKAARTNPNHIKGTIPALRLERHRKRMMAAVPKATVVITNPTHFAVALRYDIDPMAAPMVVARGADNIAKRMRQISETHDVPIVENPPLAGTLFAAVDVDQEIPQEQYKAVAEIIGYVMRLKSKLLAKH